MDSPDGRTPLDGSDPTDAELARILLRVIAGLIALLLATGVASAATRLGNDATVAESDPALRLGDPGAIGPLPGAPIATYIPERDQALAEAHGARAAVVSFAQFHSAADASRLVAPLVVLRLLVAVPGGRAVEANPDEDLVSIASAQRDEAAREKAALEQLLPSVEDPDFARQYRADIERLTALLARPATARDLVFAVVVVDSSDRLRTLAARPDVRLVDVARGDRMPPRGAAVGLRPEETVRADEPPSRPI
jgi:hypothetical protein